MHVFPTRDIHLVQAYPDAQIDLSLCDDWPPMTDNPVFTNLAALPNTVVTVQQFFPRTPLLVTFLTNITATRSPTGVSFLPRRAGVALLAISVHSNPPVIAVVRVAVHDDITRLFVPYGDIRMLVGRDDFVITVFATFSDGESWDVTEHPYLEFGSDAEAIARVDASGRIEARAPGETMVWVQPRGRQQNRVQCRVKVDTIANQIAANQIAMKRLARPAGATRRLYLVSEGYAEPLDGHDRFTKHAKEIANGIYDEANAPFRWFKQRFEITRVYVRSAGVRGVSIGPPLQHDPATNRATILEPANIVPDGHGLFDPARLSAFGLIYGARMGGAPGGQQGVDLTSAATMLSSWLDAPATRSISVDLRRVGPYRDRNAPMTMFDPRLAFTRRFGELLQALGLPALGDEDRVVFLVDDQLRGGAAFSIAGLQLRKAQFVSMTSGSEVPDWFDGVPRQAGSPLTIRVPVRDPYHAGFMSTSVVHELGHTFRLGDEYENRNNTIPAPAEAEGHRFLLERYDNLQLTIDAVDHNTVRLERVKWNASRPAKASLIRSIQGTAGSTIFVTIEGNGERMWKTDEIVRVRSSYATPRPRGIDGKIDPTVPRLRDFKYQVIAINGSVLTLFSQDIGPGHHDDLRVVYTEATDKAQQTLHLIDASVEQHLIAHGVFPRPAVGCVFTADDGQPPPNIQGVKMPTVPADLIGLYQGGGEFSCGVLRPAGRCKLRHAAQVVVDPGTFAVNSFETTEFCFVCKFIITDQIDPAMLPKVQLHYPKDC